MWQTVVLSFLAGAMGGNALPHFIKGITREQYPTVMGSAPIANLIGGWVGLLIAGGLLAAAHPDRYALGAWAAGALGVLLSGLLHAGPGAFGRR